jgi:hypothetical protein
VKVMDESAWQGRLAVMAADPDPTAQKMMKFLPTWAEAAEKLITTEEEFNPNEVPSPIEALRRTLPEVESKVWEGKLCPALLLGQALIMLGNDWELAAKDLEAFVESLTTIEKRLMIDVGQVIVNLMQSKAANGQSA